MRIPRGPAFLLVAGLTAGHAVGASPADPVEVPPRPATAVEDYDADAETLRGVVLALFDEAGLVLESSPEAPEGELLTAYLEFGPDKFGKDVATPPPTLSRVYPFFQPQKLGSGKYRMRARIEPLESGCRLDLTAELLAAGFNRMTYEHTELERHSNGVIEEYFHQRVQARLLKAASGN